MAAPKEIVDLVEKFERNFLEYKSSTYNEAQTRQEFINPFFKALGWDMDNEQGFSEAYKEVIHEASLKVGSTTKAPDYGFRVGTTIKFLVEAKKPFVNLQENPEPAYQLRSYAWNAKLPISILTDFEGLAIYDCRYPPKKTDKADTALLSYLKYDEYLARWDEIANVFSKKAILQGSFDRYAEANKSKKGIKEVDAAFLDEITSWRESLAHNIALRNLDLSIESLNSCVQSTIDRIVFLRICEDRGIEKYEQLQKIASGENIYAGLCDLFKHADDRYNSGLFHFKKEPGREYPDLLALDLKIDDKVLKDITSNLYPPGPYNFAVMPPEILGQVYEQFLGKVIRLTEGHRAKIEDKPEVKKAGGVKYTPAYIVQYIVNGTLGPLLKGKNHPNEVALIYVLDPACGSGSFLLVAYQYLLDWHLNWYIKSLAPELDKGTPITSITINKLLPIDIEELDNGKSQKTKMGAKAKKIRANAESRAAEASVPIYKTPDGIWHLKITERKRILLNNIYGVDIDRQAVEVTKLSLLLKVLEGENQQTVSDLLKYLRERALPDLGENIKCGNSLIGWDILKDNSGLEQIEIDKINPFDWEKEFPKIFQRGGFSVVIGNPPYVRTLHLSKEKEYYKFKFFSAYGAYDIFVLFMEKSLRLLRKGGLVGLITPNKYFVADYALNIRQIILKDTSLIEIADLGKCKSVFPGAQISTAITIYKKIKPSQDASSAMIKLKVLNDNNVQQILNVQGKSIPIDEIVTPEGVIRVYLDETSNSILSKISKNSDNLSNTSIAIVRTGIMGFDYWSLDKFIFDNNIGRRIATNSYIERYGFLWGKKVKIYKRDLFEPRLDPKCNVINNNTMELFASQKIVVRGVARRLTAMLDEEGIGILVAVHSVIGKKYDNRFLLGLLNSKLFNWVHIKQFYSARIPEGSLRYPISFLNNLPIHTIDFSNPIEVALYDHIITLAEQMLSLNRQLHEAGTPQDKTARQRQIEAIDGQIDALVYKLYGLTEEEIAIVEAQ